MHGFSAQQHTWPPYPDLQAAPASPAWTQRRDDWEKQQSKPDDISTVVWRDDRTCTCVEPVTSSARTSSGSFPSLMTCISPSRSSEQLHILEASLLSFPFAAITSEQVNCRGHRIGNSSARAQKVAIVECDSGRTNLKQLQSCATRWQSVADGLEQFEAAYT